MGCGDASDSGRFTGIGKSSITVIVVESILLAGERCDDQVRPTVVVVVLKIYSHARIGVSIAVDGDARIESILFEFAVALVMVEILQHRVVGYKKVGFAIMIVIGNG